VEASFKIYFARGEGKTDHVLVASLFKVVNMTAELLYHLSNGDQTHSRLSIYFGKKGGKKALA